MLGCGRWVRSGVKEGEKCEKLGRWRERIGCKGEMGVLGSVKDGGRCAKNGDGVWLMGARV